MKNDIWDVMSRPKEKFVVNSKWLFKIKHRVDGSIEKYKVRLWPKDSPRRRKVKDGSFIKWMRRQHSFMACYKKKCKLSSHKDLK